MKLVEKDGAVRFEVHAKPRAKRSAVLGVRGEALHVALAAPPVDGAANGELVRLLAEILRVPKRQVAVVRGESSTKKLVEVRGVSAELARAALLPST